MELNALGMKCPMPIVRLGRAIREVPVGGMITVMADDGPFPSDLRAWRKRTGHSLVSLDESDPRRYIAVVRKEGQ